MHEGRIQQVAAPRRLYAEPATPMVADFVGRGLVVPLDEAVAGRSGAIEARLWGHPIRLRAGAGGGTSRYACLRPENLALAAQGIVARVERAVFEGASTMLHCRVAEAPQHLLRLLHRGEPPAEGAEVRVAIEDGWLLPA
jgi:iron(III) transport system ATP-binding protein